MNVCGTWLADDFLIGDGWTIAVGADGRRTATYEQVTVDIGPACGHPPDRCPPHRRTEQRIREDACPI